MDGRGLTEAMEDLGSDDEWEGGANAGCIDWDDALDWAPHSPAEAAADALALTSSKARARARTGFDQDSSTSFVTSLQLLGRAPPESDREDASDSDEDWESILQEGLRRAARQEALQRRRLPPTSAAQRPSKAKLEADRASSSSSSSAAGVRQPPASLKEESFEPSEGQQQLLIERCSVCGAGYGVHIDLTGLDIDFQCSLVGRRCWEECAPAPESMDGSGEESELDSLDRKALVLSLVEQQRLLTKVQRQHSSKYQPNLSREALKEELQMQTENVLERYRDNAVVAKRGEKYVLTSNRAPAGPGTELSGIIGSSAKGRLGLGLRKLPKEEAERCSLSSKERGHVKKRVAHAKNEREIVVFETKRTMHELTHAKVLPVSVVR